MNSRNLMENRRLILNSKQMYLFQQQEFQLRKKFSADNVLEKKQQEDISIENVEEEASFILGYN